MRHLILALALTFGASSALADNIAVLIGNRDHDRAGSVRGADAVFDLQFPLRQAGFQVISGRDVTGDELEFILDAVLDRLDDADRLVFVMAGHVVHSGANAILLPAEANPSAGLRLQRNALSLNEVMQIAASRAGGAVVAVGTERGAISRLNDRWREGLGPIEVPQGVTLATGAPEDVTAFVDEVILDERTTVLEGVRRFDGAIAVEGFISRLHPFLGAELVAVDEDALREEGFFDAVEGLATAESYEAYLNRYPRGAFVAEAEAALRDIRERPLREAEAAERALGLDRNERRSVQRALVLLGYNTRGIDGIFGRGSRAAIRSWQAENGIFESGFLDTDQLDLLDDQAAARQAELEAEAEERARQDAARERRVWRQTEREDTAEAYRAYLERYPDGAFEEEARDRLRVFERQARRQVREQEQIFWNNVRDANTEQGYRQYIAQYPRGAFVTEANEALAAIAAQNNAAQFAARENQVLGNPVLRLLAERRLADLGLEPGRVDGQFDDATRRAIRRFQRARGIEATGYVDQPTAVRMLAEAVSNN